jgi:exopolysaccharide production protein ExoQ
MTTAIQAPGFRLWRIEWFAPYIWLTTTVSALGLIGDLAGSSLWAYLFLAIWAPVIAASPSASLKLIFRTPVLWLIPAIALASVIWSQAPAATLRAAIELILTISMATLTAGLVRPRAFVSAISVSLMFGALASLAFGRYGIDGMSGTTVFMGVFASKNTMAMFMSLLTIFSAAVCADKGQNTFFRILAAFSFTLGVPLLLKAHSAGALLTTAISFAVMGTTIICARMNARERLMILIWVTIVAIPVLILVSMLAFDGILASAISDFITGVLGKDMTFTGRTVLWKIALDQIHGRPMLGGGYSAFWIQGNLIPEGIWRAFEIDNRSGFTFHNTYLEVAVGMGWVGVAALAITLWLALRRAVELALARPGWTTACFVTIIFCLLTRSIDEVDLPSPFSMATYLLFVIASYGSDYVHGQRTHATQTVSPTQARPFSLNHDELPSHSI